MDANLENMFIRFVINDEKVSNTFFNLWGRWQDEKEYEDINEYGKLLFKALKKKITGVFTYVVMTKQPFGIVVSVPNGDKLHFFVKKKGNNSIVFCGGTKK